MYDSNAPAARPANPLLAAALDYAQRGWHVFPLRPRGKTPLTRHGYKDASADPDAIRAWWDQWPDANVGVATGLVSGLIVLDIDGPTGMNALRQLLAVYGRLPSTVVAITARGCHIYLAGRVACSCSSDKKEDGGIDIRGDGGYVVAPPSIHETGFVYRWERAPS